MCEWGGGERERESQMLNQLPRHPCDDFILDGPEKSDVLSLSLSFVVIAPWLPGGYRAHRGSPTFLLCCEKSVCPHRAPHNADGWEAVEIKSFVGPPPWLYF